MVAAVKDSITLYVYSEKYFYLNMCLMIGPYIVSIESGKIILKMKNCLFNLLGISFLPPPGWFIAPIYYKFLIFLKFPL